MNSAFLQQSVAQNKDTMKISYFLIVAEYTIY